MRSYLVFIFFLVSTSVSGLPGALIPEAEIDVPISLHDVSVGKAIVTSAHYAASAVMQDVLLQGGNAVDAAIAGLLALGVVEPQASGLFGGAFALYYDAATQQVMAFNAREIAPHFLDVNLMKQPNGRWKSRHELLRAGLGFGIPGQVDLLWKLHQAGGSLPWVDLFQPAIHLANEGFIVSSRLAREIFLLQKSIREDETLNSLFFPNGVAIKEGHLLKNLPLAQLLREIAMLGRDYFYEAIALDLIKSLRYGKGINHIQASDFKSYQTLVTDPVCRKHNDQVNICVLPAPSGGVAVLQLLGILDHTPMKNFPVFSDVYYHYYSEAMRLAYADYFMYVADPMFDGCFLEKLLEPAYLASRALQIHPEQANLDAKAGLEDQPMYSSETALPSTTHLSVVDKDGNAIALSSSLESSFGSQIGYRGSFLNGQLTDFSFSETTMSDGMMVNIPEASKRPRSAMSPTFIFDKHNDKLIGVLGSAGGSSIISYVSHMILCAFDKNISAQDCLQRPSIVTRSYYTEIEESDNGAESARMAALLSSYGDKIVLRKLTSGMHPLVFNIDEKVWYGYADPRRNGLAISADILP